MSSSVEKISIPLHKGREREHIISEKEEEKRIEKEVGKEEALKEKQRKKEQEREGGLD